MSVERRFFVKICGLRDGEAAQAAIDAGADALGFILAPSKRQVSLNAIMDVVTKVDRSDNHPSMVGVMVNPSREEITEVVDSGVIETLQLSGDERPDILGAIELPVIKALRFATGTSFEDATRQIDAWFSAAHPVARVIVEGHAAGTYGGTGTRADWELVSRLALRYPIVLAGGLNPENVGEAIREVRPWGVDVSSGVERDGAKRPDLIRRFVEEARAAAEQNA